MPRNYGYSKKPSGRKLYKPGTVVDMAVKAAKGVRYIKNLINVERKFNDTVYSGTAQTTTPVITSLSAISEGSDYNNRDGLSVKPSSLSLRGVVSAQASQTVGNVFVRCMIIRDKEGLGTAPVDSDILESKNDINSPLNHVNGKRFQVLHDKMYSISDGGGPSGHAFKAFKKLSGHIRYSNSTTGTREGQLYMLTMSSTATAIDEPLVAWYARLRFIDN